ncbi:hypothetical protein [Wolbachia endosymbiont (group A) of Apotomis capreana]|uniref:hypothetical protein n=1 Tax=Wolbachia endosymbiont (group A) of Apotomis capreana TaxID=3066165 RepID=UPI003132E1BE
MFSISREDVNSSKRVKFAETISTKCNRRLFLEFFDTEKGKAIFNSFVRNNCTSSMSCILNPLRGNAVEVLEEFHDRLFNLQGEPTPKLWNILNLGITLANLAHILSQAGASAPRAFEELYNTLFDNQGRNTPKLELMLHAGITSNNIKDILAQTKMCAAEVFNAFYDVLFYDNGDYTPLLKNILNGNITVGNIAHIVYKKGPLAVQSLQGFIGVLYDAEGNPTPELQHMLNSGLNINNITKVMSRTGVEAVRTFHELHDVLFDTEGNPTPKLQHMLGGELNVSNVARILNKAGTGIVRLFHRLYDMLFDAEGNLTPKLQHFIDRGLTISNVLTIIDGSVLRIEEIFDNLHNVLFTAQGSGKAELDHFLKSGFNLVSLFNILKASRKNFLLTFREFHDALFDGEGNPKPELQHFIDEGLAISFVCSMIGVAESKAVDAFKKLHDVLFDAEGNPKPELQHFIDQGLTISNISSMLGGAREIACPFKELHNTFFDAEGNPKPELRHMLDNGLNMSGVSSIISGSKAKSALVFKKLHDALFDAEGNPTPEQQHFIDQGMGFNCLSGMLTGAGVNAAEAFRNLHSVLFNDKGEESLELQHFIDSGITFSNVSSVIGGVGLKVQEVFKKFHDALFDKRGKPKPELQHILDHKLRLPSIFSILSQSRANAPEAFKKLHDVLFDAEGNPTPEQQHFIDQGLTISNISGMLNSSGKKAAEVFKRFHDVLFDAEGNPTPELQYILDSRINLSSVSSIIGKAGGKAPEVFKKFHDVLFDAEGNPTPELQHILDSGINLSSVSSIISKTGGKAPEVFKKFHDVLFDAEGNPTPELQHILKQNLSMSSISVVLKGSGVHGPERFKKFHGALFDAEGNPTPELQHILDNEMDFSSFCSGISEARTPEAFKAFHDVLFDAEGNPTPELQRILDSGISLSSLSGIINGSGIRAPEAFKKFHDVLFDAEGNPTPELQNILSSKLIISNLLSILAESGIRAPEVFKELHDVLFDDEGNPTPKLLSVLSGKVSFSYISSALSHSGAEAVKRFNKFHNALFDIRGNPTPELQHMLDYKIDLSSISNITNGSKERASETFEAFHDVLFDAEGNPTPELQHILNSKIDFGNISCVLAQTGGKAPEVFKAFHDVLFDDEGNPTPELQHILGSRINLSSLSGIINGSKVNAPKVFKAFHDVLFDVEGNPTPELQHMLGNKVNFSTVFSMIPARTGEEAPKVFKALHDVLFDDEGNPTPELQHILNSEISLASLSSIIRKSGTKVPETFKAFHDVLFDAEGNPTPELQHIFDTKITFSFLSAVLISSGTRVLETFKAFHDVLFDAEGNPTPELQHILGSRINLSSLSAIIGKAGTKAPDAFKKLHDVLFDAEGNPTPELQHTFDSGIRMTSILCVLNQSGINYARAFKKLHDVLFDAEGNPTPELQHILNSKIDFSSISRVLSGSGVKIAETFKKFHDILFDAEGNPTPELQHILNSKISSSALLNVLAKAGANAPQVFKKLHDVLFDAEGISTPELQHILDSELTLDNFFSILADAGTNAAEEFKGLHDDFFDCYGELTTDLQHMLIQQMDPDNISAVLHGVESDVKKCFQALHDTLFDSWGVPLPSLQAMLNNEITINDISDILSREGERVPEVFKELDNILLDAGGNPTPELQHILNSKIDFSSISRALSGSGVRIGEAFKKFHDVLFDNRGKPKPELQHILNSKIDFSSISRALSGSGVRIGEAFKKFHDVLFDNRGKPKPELQHILDKKISFAEVCSVLSKTGVEAAECFKELCGFWFSPQGEKVSDDYIASIFNPEMMGNNSLFNFGKNIADIYKVLSRWPVEVLNSRNVQYLAGKLIENGKKFSKDFEFREIVSILSVLIRLCRINQGLATSSHVTFNANVYRIFVSDLLDQAIKLAPEEHNINHIINMTYILSALVHNNLVTIKSQLSILIGSLVVCLSNCELDNIYSDKNWLHISSIVACLGILVNLVNREKETFVDKGFTNNIVNLLSNIDSLQSNISDSSKILLVLSKISRSTREKVETNFLVRAIGKVLDKLQYIHQCSDQDLALEIYSNIGRLSDRLKNLLHSNWFLDNLLSNIPLSKKEKFLKSIGKDGPVEVSKGHHLITDNILIDEDRSEKYTLTQFKEKLKKEGKVKYEEGIENYVRYDHGALDFDYEFNIEKNHSKIMIAKIAYLVERTVYGVFLATNESIEPKTFLGTYVGTGMEDDKEMNQHVLERDSTVSIVSEKGRNWASYMNLVSIGNSNVSCISKRIARHVHLTLSTNREILPGHQLLCDHVQDFSFKLGYTPIYPHYTDNHESPAQRYNREKDFYYGCVIDLDKEITRDLGYHGSKHFVVTKLFKQIYDKHNFQQEYASGSTVLSLEGLYVPIYAVTFRDKKWCFDRYDRQQQITSLMFSCYLGQEDTIKLLLEKKDDVTRQSLHTGNNALFFTVLSNKTNSGTKKRILSLLINHLERAEQVNGNKKKVISFRSRVLCTTNSSGYNLFDYLINRGEYSLYQELYRKLNPEYQRKVARKFMIDRGVFSMVLTLGEEEYIKIINLLLKNISIKFIKEHFESLKRKEINYKKVLERLLVNNRDEKLNNLRKLTNLNEYIKKNIEILLGQGYQGILSYRSSEEQDIRTDPEHTPERQDIRPGPEHTPERQDIRPGPEHTPEEPNIRPGPEHTPEEPNIRPGPEHTPEEPNIRPGPEHTPEEPNIRPGPEHTPEEPNIRPGPEHTPEEPNIRPGPEHTPERQDIRPGPEHTPEEPNIRPGPEHTPEEPNIRPGPEHTPEEPNIRLDTEHILEGQVVDLLKNMEKVQDEADKYWKDKKGQKEPQVIAYLRTTQLSEISLSDTLETSSYRKINLLNKQIVLQILLWSVLKNKDTSGLQEVLSQASLLGLDQVILSSFEFYSIRLAINYADHEDISLILDKVDSSSRQQMMESGILYSLVLDESSNNFAPLDFLLEKANNYYRDDQHFLIKAIKATIYSHEKPYEGRRWNGRSAFNFLIEKTTSNFREGIFQSIHDSYQSVLQCLYNPNIRPGPEHTPEEPNIRPGPEHTPEEPNIRPGPEHTPEEPNIRPGPEHTPERQDIRPGPEHTPEEPNIRPGPEHTPEEPNIRPGPEHTPEEPNIRLDTEHILEGQVVDLLKNMEKVQDEADKYWKDKKGQKEPQVIAYLRTTQLSEISLSDTLETSSYRKINLLNKQIVLQILLWSVLKNKDTSGLQEVLSQASLLGLDQVILSSFEFYSIRLAINYADHEDISLILDKVDSSSRQQMMESGILYSLVLDESSNNFAPLDFLLEKANNYYRDDQHFLIKAIKATIYSHEKPYEGRRWNGRSAFNFLIEKTTSNFREGIFQSIHDSYQSVLQCLYNPNIRPGPEHTPEEPNIRPGPEHTPEEPNIRPGPEHTPEEPNIRPGPEHTPERQDIRPGPEHTPEEPNIRPGPEHTPEEPNIRPGPEHTPEEPNIRLDTEHILEGQVVDLLKNMEKVQDEADKYWKDKKGQKEPQVIAYLRTTQLSEISLSDTLETSSYRKINLLNKQIVLQILLWSVLKNKDTSGLQEVLSQASLLGLDQVILSSFEFYSIRLAINYADHEDISLILDKVDSSSRQQMMESGILYSLVLDESSNNFAPLDFLLEKANNYYRDDQHFLIKAIKATIYSHEKPYEGRRWNGRSAFNFLIEKTTSNFREGIFQSIHDSYQSVLQCLYNPNIRPGPEHTPEEPNIRPGPEHTPEEPNIRPGPEHTPERQDIRPGPEHTPEEPNIRPGPEHTPEEPNIRPGPEHTPEEPNIRPGPEHTPEEPNIRLDTEHILEGQVVDLLKNMEKVQDEADKYWKDKKGQKEPQVIAYLRTTQLSEISLSDTLETSSYRKINLLNKQIVLQILLWSVLKNKDTSGLQEVLSQASLLGLDQVILSSFEFYSIRLAINYADHEDISLILDKVDSSSRQQMMESGILYSLVLDESSNNFAPLDFLLEKANNYYRDDQHFLIKAIKATIYSHEKPYEGRRWNGRSAFNFLIEKTTSNFREGIFQSIHDSYQSVLQCLYNPNIRPGPEHTPEEPNIRPGPEHTPERQDIRPGPEHTPEEPNIRPGPEHTPERQDIRPGPEHTPEEPNIRPGPEHTPEEPNIRPGPEHTPEEPNIRLDTEHILEGQVVDLLKNMEKVQDEADKYWKDKKGQKEPQVIAYLRTTQLSEISLSDTLETSSYRKINLLNKQIVLQILLWSVLKNKDTSGLQEVLSQASLLGLDQVILSSFEFYSIRLAINYADHEDISLILDKVDSSSRQQMMESGILYSLVLDESSNNFAPLDFLLEKANNYYRDDQHFLIKAIKATIYSHEKPYEGRRWNGRSAFNFLIEKTTSNFREGIFQSIHDSYQSVLQCLYNPNIRPGPEHTPEEPNIRPGPEHTPEEPNIRPGPEHTPERQDIRPGPEHTPEEPNIRPGPEHTPEEPNIRPGPEHTPEEPNIRLDTEHILEGQVVDLLKNMEKVQDEADKYWKDKKGQKEPQVIAYLRTTQLSEISLSDTLETSSYRKINLLNKQIVLQILLWSVLKNKDTSGLQEVLSQASLLGLDQVILSSFEFYSIRLAINYADHEDISLILDKVDSSSRQQMMESGILYSLVLDESSNNFAPLDFLLEKANNYYRDDQHFLIKAIKATIYSHEKPYEGRRWNGRSAFNFLIEKTTSNFREGIFQSIHDSYQSVLQCLYNPNIRPGPEHTPEEPNIRPGPEHTPEEPNIRPGPEHTPEEPNIRPGPEHTPERQDIRPGPEHTPEEPNIRPGPEHTPEEPNIRPGPEHTPEEPNIRPGPEHTPEGPDVDRGLLAKHFPDEQKDEQKFKKLLYVMRPSDPSSLLHQPLAQRRIGRESNILEK